MKPRASRLTPERLRELLAYDPETGAFTRKVATARNCRVGQRVGYRTRDGYLRMMLDWESHLAHRLAWLYIYGRWPDCELDHINSVRADNRIANLRDVSRTVNAQNLKAALSGNATLLLGVTYAPRREKYQSSIRANGRQRWLGYFNTPEAAHAAYIAAKRELHSGCTI